jgi:dolichyl-phosphate beta-glucosyltransferase
VRAHLRRFAAVGSLATVIDVVLAVTLSARGWSLLSADLVALAAAAATAYVLHRVITLRDDPHARWIHRPGMFLGVVLLAGAVDVALFTALGGGRSTGGLVLAKLVAVVGAAMVRAAAYRTLLFRVVRSEQEAPVPRPAPAGGVRLSVVVPAYREEDRIAAAIAELRAELADLGPDLQIVVVDDGSGDGTAAAAGAAGADIVVRLPVNRGKGGAVRAGMLAATGRVRVFTDADLAYPPAQIRLLLDRVEDGWDVVVGNRRHAGTTTLVRAGRVRDIGGRLVNVVTHALLLGQYRDTQCGLKAFRSDVADAVFSVGRIDGFAFDVEVLHLVERYRLSLLEVPVTVRNSERSTVRAVRDGVRLVRDLVRIRGFAKRGAYDPVAPLPVLDVGVTAGERPRP